MKLAVFDFDSTLMDGETIDLFAKELGIEKKVSVITEKDEKYATLSRHAEIHPPLGGNGNAVGR